MSHFEPSVAALRLVLKVVETGKLTTAASLLRISQSGASHALKTLEEQLGAELFVREWEGLKLSEAGQRLLPRIDAALTSLEAIRSEATGLREAITGRLRIAAVPSLLATVLPPVLREYTELFPGIELSIFEGTDDEVRAWVVSNIAHSGFAALPVEGVKAEEIARDEWMALVPARKAKQATSITLAELARNKFLMSGGGCERHIEGIFASARIDIPNPMLVKQLATIQAMVAQDLGVSLVPSLSIGNVHGCRALRLKPRLFRRIGMLTSASPISTPALEAWRTLVRTKLKRRG
jgi:DNA-binding transcriptional LysR family regulator